MEKKYDKTNPNAEEIVRKQLDSIALDDEQEQDDDFDAMEASEEQFKEYMIKTFGEEQYTKGYAFVYNFRDKLHEPKTR